jgi:tetratricopeptide (TPR) repeat protein
VESSQRRQEGLIAASEGRHQDAIAAFRDVWKENPKDANTAMLLGLELVRAGEMNEGIRTLAEATQLDPTDARIWSNLAVARMQKGQTILAFSDAQKALAIDPDDPAAREVAQRAESAPPDVAALANREPFWTRLGIAITILGFCATVLVAAFPPIYLPTKSGDDSGLRTDPRSQYIVLYWIFMGIVATLWMVLDILNRRARLTWLLPSVICCVCGVPWGPLGLYLIGGRRSNRKLE